MRHASAFITATASSLLFCFCTEAGPLSSEESFTLRAGETARSEAAGITIHFNKVVSDSRCPRDVNCIRAGEAIVRFTVGAGGGAGEPLQFKVPPGGSDTARFRDLQITIVELNPQTESGKRIEHSDYEASVRVSQQ